MFKIGDKVRVIFRSDKYPNQWFGDEGIIISQHEISRNFEVHITKIVGTKEEKIQHWSEGDLELILPEGSIEEAFRSRTNAWKEFFGV